MPTATALDVITASLRRIGVHPAGEVIEGDEGEDALDELNRMLDSWGAQRRMVYRRVTGVMIVTSNQATITIGPGGDINMPVRPLAIREAFYRIGTIDYPIEQFTADQYFNVGLKSLRTFWPTVLYYDPAWPLGIVNFYPIINSAGEFHFGADQAFTPFVAVTDQFSYPPGYADAMIYGLGQRLAPEYGKTLSQEYMDAWRRAENTLAKVNHRPVVAITDPRLPGAGVTDPQWIQHGGFR